MKNIKKIIIVLLVCAVAISGGLNYSLAKTKIIRLNRGETYNLKISNRKAVKLSSSNKQIATVNKKGKIKAHKKGKCIIKVEKGKKVSKYKVVVSNKDKTDGINNVPNNIKEPEKQAAPESTSKTSVDWSKVRMPMGFGIYKVFDITEKDDLNYIVCFVKKDDNSYAALFDRSNVDFIKVEIQKTIFDKATKPIKVGDNASFIYYPGNEKWIVEGDTLYISGLDISSVHNETRDELPDSTPLPTQSPRP